MDKKNRLICSILNKFFSLFWIFNSDIMAASLPLAYLFLLLYGHSIFKPFSHFCLLYHCNYSSCNFSNTSLEKRWYLFWKKWKCFPNIRWETFAFFTYYNNILTLIIKSFLFSFTLLFWTIITSKYRNPTWFCFY